MMYRIKLLFISTMFCLAVSPVFGQESATDSVVSHAGGNRLSMGGYGEIVFSRNFYSDSPFKYSSAAAHKDDPSHGRFDIPHAVIYLNYDFGKGWTFNTEIEFEHGGAGGAVEREGEEGGEWESETEKGGEVELEQFWIQKSFSKALNIRAGHLVVPFGLTNAHHEPLNFFTVYRSEGENTILPSTWHQTGVSVWGRVKDFRYELQLTSGLDAYMFDRVNWIHYGANSPYEFEVANKYGVLARVDYTTPRPMRGGAGGRALRLGFSGYFGQSMHNTFPHDMENPSSKYKNVKGNVYLGAFDFTFKSKNWIARGNVDYGYVSDAKTINDLKANQSSGASPYRKAAFGSHAVATSIEAGYNVLSLLSNNSKLKTENSKLYIFAHYEYYDSYLKGINKYTQKQIFAAGINYMPLPQIALKAEYNYRKLCKPFNDEPSINLSICYQGFFR